MSKINHVPTRFLWPVFGLVTGGAFVAESTGYHRLASSLYGWPAGHNFPPALYHLALLLTDFMGTEANWKRGKLLMHRANSLGHAESARWIEKHGHLTDDNADLAKELITWYSDRVDKHRL